ncbi:hypothetical protein BS50DRAFT_160628 [Corynespora cassiicola Philippines]|uniref:Uncharacterized protein n=1 Tax=Corynespora cassiicola Philippines TaxID=1448308 RepID=A0A2T2N697_CORCC|nr:hypothetical protein BS50DRAFT_160628 [Corynespora cassiicola Philippines]
MAVGTHHGLVHEGVQGWVVGRADLPFLIRAGVTRLARAITGAGKLRTELAPSQNSTALAAFTEPEPASSSTAEGSRNSQPAANGLRPGPAAACAPSKSLEPSLPCFDWCTGRWCHYSTAFHRHSLSLPPSPAPAPACPPLCI